MKQLKENKGIERSLLLTMAVIAGLTVANCIGGKTKCVKMNETLNQWKAL